MSTSQKITLSLLISVFLFVVFAAIAFSGLFDLLEAHFYNPSVTANIIRANNRNADMIDNFFLEMQERFSETLARQEVRRSFQSNHSLQDISARSEIYKNLMEIFDGIQWVRFIDSGGRRIQYSSYAPDILRHEALSTIYVNYYEPDLPYETVAVKSGGEPKLTFDGKLKRVLFSFPFYDSFDIYRGTALFSLSMSAVPDKLINEGRILFDNSIAVIQDPPGFVFGMPVTAGGDLFSRVSSVWKGGHKISSLVSAEPDLSFVLVSTVTSRGFFVGRLASEELFSFPLTMKIILLLSFFLTVYLIIFLLFSLRQDPVTIIQHRMKRLQISLIEQFFELKGGMDWSRWAKELEQHRSEIIVQLKRGIKDMQNPKDSVTANGNTDIDAIINKFLDELISAIGNRGETGIDEEKLKSVLKNILATLQEPSVLPSDEQVPAAAIPSEPVVRRGLLMKASAIAREIEDAELVEDLEIVSPFSEMLNDLSQFTADRDTSDNGNAFDSNDIFDNNDVIKEREGVPFISGDVLNSEQKKSTALNQDFKDLVDSVIK